VLQVYTDASIQTDPRTGQPRAAAAFIVTNDRDLIVIMQTKEVPPQGIIPELAAVLQALMQIPLRRTVQVNSDIRNIPRILENARHPIALQILQVIQQRELGTVFVWTPRRKRSR